jgi:lantibiotic leader peptide-processing serine protease
VVVMRKLGMLVLGFLLFIGSIPAYAKTNVPSNIHLTVVFKGNQLPIDVNNIIEKSKGKILRNFPNIGAVEIFGSAELINTLKKNTSIQAVSPTIVRSLPKVKKVDFNPQDVQKYLKSQTDSEDRSTLKINNNDPQIRDPFNPFPDDFPLLHHVYQWDIKRVTNFGESYKMEKGNHNVVVGIIDTGVDKDHPDLVNNLIGGRNYVPAGGINGNDPSETGDENDFEDRNGHGSHVAGTIAGKGAILGVAPEVGFKAYRVFGSEGGASTATIADAIIGATNDGVDVISMSLGGYNVLGQIMWTDPATGTTYKLGNEVADFLLYKRAVKYATDHGVTVVAAAGNDNLNVTNKSAVTDFLNNELGSQGYKFIGAGFETPGTMPGVITVSATGPDDQKASYSNYGAGFVDVTAPGGDGERYPDWTWYEDLTLSTYMEDSYIFMAGTSMATPKVSAVAALIIAQEGKMSPDKVAQRIKETTEEVGNQGKDIYFGSGMVQAPHQPIELAENVEWQKSFGGLGYDVAMNVSQTDDGGYLVLGYTESYIKEPYPDLYLIKTYPDGRIQWRKVINEIGYELPIDMQETKDGGYILLTYSYNFQEDGRYEYTNLIKMTQNGDIEWKKQFGGLNHIDGGASIVVTDDGYVMAGASGLDAMLMKVNLAGNVIWKKTYGGAASDSAFVIKPTPDGGFIVGGQTYSNPIGHKKDFYIFKVNHEGELEWENMYGKGDFIQEYITDIEVTSDGGYMVVGTEANMVYEGYSENEEPNIYYAKINRNGEVAWEKVIGERGSYEEASSIIATKDGNFMIAGAVEKESMNKDVYILKFNENGDTLSEQMIGGDISDFATDIQETRDGGYIVVGNTKSYVNGFKEAYGVSGDRDIYMIKLK